ncbi:MAG: hypothetical protein P8Y64_05940 [Gammaproteobacteria bacterium]|jgi:hypothetical protein
MSKDTAEKPQIPLEVFRKLVFTLSPEELAKLPPEKLPENIPADFTEEAPLYSRAALEGLILASNSYHLNRRLTMQGKYGDEIMDALDQSRMKGLPASIRVFKNKVLDLAALFQEYGKSDEQKHQDLLSTNVRHLGSLLMDVRSENTRITRLSRLLESTLQKHREDRDVFTPAIRHLHNQSERIERLLAEFYLLRLNINAIQMRKLAAIAEQHEEEARNLFHEAEAMRAELEKTQTVWRRTMNKKKADDEAREIRLKIETLINEQKAREVAISENDLTHWLDTIVDVSVHPYTRERVGRTLNLARLALYNLLDRYCVGQERGARQIARNPFLQIDAKQAIQYLLLSEQFILDYFAKKRNQATAFLSDVAQIKIEDLDALEGVLLSELKKNSRFGSRG